MEKSRLFLAIEIALKEVHGNNVDFSTGDITARKVRGNNVDFSISENSSRKYVEMTRKIVEIWSLTYRLNIEVESTWTETNGKKKNQNQQFPGDLV